MTRPRVLLLTKTTAVGGAERLLMNSLPHLDRGAFDYRLAACDDDGPLAAAWREAGLPFWCLPHARVLDPRNAVALRRALVAERIDLVHAHLPLPGALARMAARGLATRRIYTEHAAQQNYRAPSRWLNAATYGWQERVVAVSHEVQASAERRIGARARERTCVIPNGVDFDTLEREAAARPQAPLPARPRGAFQVLVPASLKPAKGHEVLFEAVARLREQPFPPLRVWLAGDGPRRETLLGLRRRLGLEAEIALLGRRDDVFALMREADAVVLPSHVEGHPLALLEALALGRPALATAVGGVPEIVAAEQTGLLVPPGDPAALAAGLERLRSNPALRARLGRSAARDARRRFDVRRSVAALEALYRACLASAEPGARSPRRVSRPMRPGATPPVP